MNEQDYQIMPELTDDEYDRLKADIAENGCKVPIDVDEDGVILDGNNRAEICEELGIEYETRVIPDLTDEEKYAHVLRMNVIRRQLAGERLDEVVRRVKEKFPEFSDRRLADMIGIDNSTVTASIKRQEEKNSGWDEDDESEEDEWENEEWDSEDDEWDDEDWDYESGVDIEEIKKLLGKDGKRYPGRNAKKQREAVCKEIAKNPDKTDYQIAKELGVSNHTVTMQRKRMDEEPCEAQGTAEEEAAKQDDLSAATADEMFAVLKGEAERLDGVFSSLLDKNGANAALLATDEGLEAAVGGLVEITEVIQKYRELITG